MFVVILMKTSMIFDSSKTSYLRNIVLRFITFSKSIDFLKVNQTYSHTPNIAFLVGFNMIKSLATTNFLVADIKN